MRVKRDREAIVLAGGLGTRLISAVPDFPKVLAPVAGKPFLAHVLDYLEQNQFSRIILAVGYRHEEIKKIFGARFGAMALEYSLETQPLGTGGAIWLAAQHITQEKDFFVFNGDTYAEFDFAEMEESLTNNKSDIAMAVRHMPDTSRYGFVTVNDEGIVEGFHEKIIGHAGIINAGGYLMRHDLMKRYSFPESFSFEKEFLQSTDKKLRISAVPMKNYFIDIGIPEDYEKACREFL